MRSKINEINNNVSVIDYDVLVLTETWLDHSVLSSELFDGKYSILRSDRSVEITGKSRGGGVLCAVKKTIVIEEIECNLKETVLFKAFINNNNWIYICGVYFAPNAPCSDYCYFFEYLENKILASGKGCVILGDFNMPNIDWNKYKKNHETIFTNTVINMNAHTGKFHDVENYSICESIFGGICEKELYNFMNTTSCDQINFITNSHGNILDLIITSTKLNINCTKSIDIMCSEDLYHPALECTIGFAEYVNGKNKNKIKSNMNTNEDLKTDSIKYNYKQANFTGIVEALSNVDWSCIFSQSDPNTATVIFYDIMNAIIHEFVPITKIKTGKFPNWMSKNTRSLIKKKNYLAKKRNKDKHYVDNLEYNNLREQAKIAVATDRENHAVRIENELSANPKNFFKNYKKITGKTLSTYDQDNDNNKFTYKGFEVEDTIDISNAFADNFFSTFNSDQDGSTDSDSNEHLDLFGEVADAFQFGPITKEIISKKIDKIKPNFSCIPGFLPNSLVKGCKHWLMYPLAHIFNISIISGIYPDLLKRSFIIPHHKSGNAKVIENYRPISSTDVIAKLFESIISDQIVEYIADKISVHQHGFVAKRGTITNLAFFTRDIATNISEGCQTDAIYTDFRKAFDSVRYDVLNKDLINLGFSANSRKWIFSLLNKRHIRVLFRNTLSRAFSNNQGVAQGSPLSAPLFNIKINTVTSAIVNSNYLLFADDLKIYRSIKNEDDCLLLQCDINNLIRWSENNKLYLNFNKCSVITFYRTKSYIGFDYNMKNTTLKRVTSTKDLGIIFNEDLTFRTHIDTIVSRANRNLGILKRNTEFIKNYKSLELLFFTYIRTILEYGSAIWSPYIINEVNSIELVQNKFLRFSYYKLFSSCNDFDRNVYHSVTNLRSFFNIKPLKERREYLTLVFFKRTYDNNNMRDMLFGPVLDVTKYNNLRNKRRFLIPMNIKTDYLRNIAIFRFCHLYYKYFNNDELITCKYDAFCKLCLFKIF